ncbi:MULTISPECIES: MerR family transcriptional regulator [unclassified Streptomyces]|uniref:MerR family transcriptional regulator n=1 Tax=unclassified Streptomyces TaxID=2593676 RepID=UPI0008DDB85B|nr:MULTISPECIES: MerR family transcriptional regulator [unclassified Streptomyces]OII67166.1 transcriptional regulator [Streptomyces sp. CC77]
MRLAELSERSGVSTATIKYYLREGLLPPGRRITATTADYGEDHLRRLRLVRALIQVGGLPVAKAREVLGHVDDDSLGRTIRLGAALWALPQGPEPQDGEAAAEARTEVDRLLAALGWASARELGELSPVHRSLVALVAVLLRLGYPCDAELMEPYARLMRQVAVHDMDRLDAYATETEGVEAAVVSAVLFEPVLRALHRLAQEEEAARRYGL